MSVQIRPPYWKEDQAYYYEGEIQVSSANKIIGMPVGFMQARATAGGEAHLDFLGIRKGTLAMITFKKVKWLDQFCAQWIADRGIIDLDQMSLDAMHYMGEFRRLLNAK